MPIFGGPPGLTFNFEREAETIPGLGNLVLGDSKIICGMTATNICELQLNETGGTWGDVVTPDGGAIEAHAVAYEAGYFISTEAARWRLRNTNAGDQIAQLSVINVG